MFEAEKKVKDAGKAYDRSNFHIPKKAKLEKTGQKTKAGKSVVKPPEGINFIDDYIYYDVQGQGTYYRYIAEKDILIPLDI